MIFKHRVIALKICKNLPFLEYTTMHKILLVNFYYVKERALNGALSSKRCLVSSASRFVLSSSNSRELLPRPPSLRSLDDVAFERLSLESQFFPRLVESPFQSSIKEDRLGFINDFGCLGIVNGFALVPSTILITK